jgi:hypothetical protein
MGVMRGLLVVAGLVVLGGLPMMLRGVLVMLRGSLMMVLVRLRGHGILLSKMTSARDPDELL